MDTAPKIVLQNPYRILGVYANSPKKDIVANKGRAIAFLNVNRPVEFPLDLKGILPTLNRTLDLMNEAEAHLAIAKEQIKYAQFWFLQKMTPLDDIAFNHLLSGNISSAKEIWSKQESLSSLQNKLVCYLIENKPQLAVKTAEKLYEKFGADYIRKIDVNCTLQMSATDLLHQFIDSLGEEIGMQKLLGYELGTETKAYISSQTVGPLINKISSEVEKAKKVDHKDPKARIEAARKLVSNTKEALSQLKGILPATDSQYQMIADKLGLEILQCGIDYFNNSEEEGRHQTAMKMQKYAQSVVVGNLAKQRCEENVMILQDMIDKLPPEDAKKEHENLQKNIALFILLPVDVDAVLKFLKDTCTDLVSIKEKLGRNNPFYIQQATLVAQIALSKSIDALNEAQEKELPKLKGISRVGAIKTMKHVFAASWEIMLWIELIDADSDFKANRLNPNKMTLKSILEQVGAFDGAFSVFAGCVKGVTVDKYLYFTESELFDVCNSIQVCEVYIKKFPQGKNVSYVRKKLLQLKDDYLFANSTTIDQLNEYLKSYPHGRHVLAAKEKKQRLLDELQKKREREIRELLKQIDDCKNIGYCKALKTRCDNYYNNTLNKKIEDKLYELCKSKEDFKEYLRLFPAGHFVEKAIYQIRKRNNFVIAAILHIACVIGGYIMYYFIDSIDVDAKWNYVIIGAFIGIATWLLPLGEYLRYKRLLVLDYVCKIAAILIPVCCFTLLYKWQENEYAKQRLSEIIESYNSFIDNPNVDKGLRFLASYKDCGQEKENTVKEITLSLLKNRTDSLLKNSNDNLEELNAFYKKYSASPLLSNNEDLTKIEERARTIEAEQKRKLAKLRLQQSREQEERRKREEYEKYGTDANAWRTATRLNTISSYRDYLSRYPKGTHVSNANKRIIDLEVEEVYNSGDYGYLPPSQKMTYGTSSTSIVHIKNSSSSTITLLYSGIRSLRIVLNPHQTQTISLPSSTYKVVATAPGVRSFYGTEDLTGGDYESEYYITTSR